MLQGGEGAGKREIVKLKLTSGSEHVISTQ